MVGFINDHRDLESICAVLPIAPSTYFRHEVQRRDPDRRSAHARRDDALRGQIQRVWDEHFRVYGPRKVWRQLRREGLRVARCTVRRLMQAMGIYAGGVRTDRAAGGDRGAARDRRVAALASACSDIVGG